jgi:thiol-disulfide isomerase/thioredoxin
MKWFSSLSLPGLLTITVLTAASFAQSSQILPGCEPAPEVRKALAIKIEGENFEQMKLSDQDARQEALYEQLIAKYPREVQPYNQLIGHAYDKPSLRLALQEKFRKQATESPDDPLALYIAGFVLFGTDTPESLRLLEAARSKASEFPWPAVVLAATYSTGKRVDKQKSSENLKSFFATCPDSTDQWAQSLLARSEDIGLQRRVATALRSRLARETDSERLKDYQTLWSLEFRVYPPQEHPAERKRVAEDLKRIEALNSNPDSSWQAFLISGYKQAGASSEAITAREDRLLREYPSSNEAYEIVYKRWQALNKEPTDQKDAAAWASYDSAYQHALQDWIRDFPGNHSLAGEDWFYAIFDDDASSEKNGIAAVDKYLRYSSEYRRPSSGVQFTAADFLLKHNWQPSRALDLLQQAKTLDEKEAAERRPDDNFSAEVQSDLDRRQLWWELLRTAETLKAAQLAGRPDAAKALRPLIEGPAPSQEKLLSQYWWNRARLAALEGRKQDALAYYQLSLQSRSQAPQYSRGKFRDDLTDEARALWKDSGGTSEAWAVWSKPPGSQAKKSDQGAWEKATKTLPTFELADLSGKTWRLKDLGGKAVLINVWATWCGPCNAELPYFQKLYEELKGRSDIQLLTFDIDDDLGMVAPYLKEKGYTFPVVPALSLVNSVLDQNVGIPQIWVLDPKGTWQWTQVGYGAEDDWARVMMQKLETAKISK